MKKENKQNPSDPSFNRRMFIKATGILASAAVTRNAFIKTAEAQTVARFCHAPFTAGILKEARCIGLRIVHRFCPSSGNRVADPITRSSDENINPVVPWE